MLWSIQLLALNSLRIHEDEGWTSTKIPSRACFRALCVHRMNLPRQPIRGLAAQNSTAGLEPAISTCISFASACRDAYSSPRQLEAIIKLVAGSLMHPRGWCTTLLRCRGTCSVIDTEMRPTFSAAASETRAFLGWMEFVR